MINPELYTPTPEQLAVAHALAGAHSHVWGNWNELSELAGFTLLQIHDLAAPHAGEMGGVTAPTVMYYPESQVPYLGHATGTGRLTWNVPPYGDATFEVWRPLEPGTYLWGRAEDDGRAGRCEVIYIDLQPSGKAQVVIDRPTAPQRTGPEGAVLSKTERYDALQPDLSGRGTWDKLEYVMDITPRALTRHLEAAVSACRVVGWEPDGSERPLAAAATVAILQLEAGMVAAVAEEDYRQRLALDAVPLDTPRLHRQALERLLFSRRLPRTTGEGAGALRQRAIALLDEFFA